ncbi:exodeoxyribonuclease III [Apibacter sp. HY039]|uniref:exodeoxyribonuclease III n=1 Tax=Apibacter sp. HY039 TaxID=2501476 RepID=UPI000FEBB20F|nr:exodeoxyribonuclease III [Apibacter sp. HY039]
MKLLSYNVNGLRAAINKDFLGWLKSANPDILCLQEVKATPEQFDTTVFKDLGYYCYWFPAEKKGYSGVAILSKEKPLSVKYGCDQQEFDSEGRVIQANFKEFSVLSVYVPSATNMGRLGFKMDFCEYLLTYIQKVEKEFSNLIINGDFNICHHAIDINDPVRNAKVSGFLPEEREWLDRFFSTCKLTDCLRVFNQEPFQYSWWTYRVKTARQNNKGWRIDYNLVTEPLKSSLKRAYILTQAVHSDHAPVGIDFDLQKID